MWLQLQHVLICAQPLIQLEISQTHMRNLCLHQTNRAACVGLRRPLLVRALRLFSCRVLACQWAAVCPTVPYSH